MSFLSFETIQRINMLYINMLIRFAFLYKCVNFYIKTTTFVHVKPKTKVMKKFDDFKCFEMTNDELVKVNGGSAEDIFDLAMDLAGTIFGFWTLKIPARKLTQGEWIR